MTPYGVAPELRVLARQLGLESRGDCVSRLRRYAVWKVRKRIQVLEVASTRTLLELVSGIVSLRIRFIRDDADIPRFADEHTLEWPELAGQLRHDFLHRNTLGLVLAHPKPTLEGHRFWAYIDARAERSVQAYFTAWHEIAHLLLQPPQIVFPGFRRVLVDPVSPKNPVEALVDQVAGDLAFFEPLVRPELEKEVDRVGRLTLDGVDRIRAAVAPDASFSSCAHALVRLTREPVAFLVAELRLKPTEARALSTDQLALIEGPRPKEKLRIVSVFPNDRASAAGLRIFRNMRVPERSVIAQAYYDGPGGSYAGEEDQSSWESGGRHLAPLPLRIEARKFGSVVYALCGWRTD